MMKHQVSCFLRHPVHIYRNIHTAGSEKKTIFIARQLLYTCTSVHV